MLAEQIRQPGVEPIFVPNLDSELASLYIFRPFEQLLQTSAKLIGTLENPFIEFWELQKHWADLVAQQVHPLDELVEFWLTLHQDFLVCDDLRDLHREDEICGSLLAPACDGRGGWRAVKVLSISTV